MAGDQVEIRETHISRVLLVGRRAYKLKKPVRLPFVDYGTLERRHDMCREEVRLNRRLAPDIYLGVRALMSADELELGPEDAPAPSTTPSRCGGTTRTARSRGGSPSAPRGSGR
jgi:aminoglycoside phosphotransferase family enzyme